MVVIGFYFHVDFDLNISELMRMLIVYLIHKPYKFWNAISYFINIHEH